MTGSAMEVSKLIAVWLLMFWAGSCTSTTSDSCPGPGKYKKTKKEQRFIPQEEEQKVVRPKFSFNRCNRTSLAQINVFEVYFKGSARA